MVSRLVVLPETGHLWMDRHGQYNAVAGEKARSEAVAWFQQHLT